MAKDRAYWAREAAAAAREAGVRHPAMFVAQIEAESNFDDDVIYGRRNSRAGAQGIAQIMPDTARGWGVNPLKPKAALRAAAKAMAQYERQFGSYEKALRAYNAGPGAVQKSYGYAETNAYVNRIKQNASRYRRLANQAGSSAAGGGGGGTVTTPGTPAQTIPGVTAMKMPTAAPVSEQAVALAQQLAQPRSAPAVSAPAAPSFAAGAVGPGGEKLPVVAAGAPAAAPETVTNAIAQAAVTQGPTTQVPDVPDLHIPGTPATTSSRGPVLVVGDSLEVGMAPLLKERVGGRVDVVAKGGISSSHALEAARDKIQSGRYGTIVFDLGTNDASAKETVHSLRQVLRMAPDARVVIATVNSPYDEKRKNQALRTIAANHPNVQLVKWHKASQGGAILADGIHGAYDKRADLFAGVVGQAGGGGQQQAGGYTGAKGAVKKLPTADRAGVSTKPIVTNFLEATAGVLGKPVTISYGTNHSQYVKGRPGVESDHWRGNGADLGSVANGFSIGGRGGDRVAAAALIAAGVAPARARTMARKGSAATSMDGSNTWNIRPTSGPWKGHRIQIIWKAGPLAHYDHVHVGVQ